MHKVLESDLHCAKNYIVQKIFKSMQDTCTDADSSVFVAYTLVTKRKVYFGLLADIAVFILQPKI